MNCSTEKSHVVRLITVFYWSASIRPFLTGGQCPYFRLRGLACPKVLQRETQPSSTTTSTPATQLHCIRHPPLPCIPTRPHFINLGQHYTASHRHNSFVSIPAHSLVLHYSDATATTPPFPASDATSTHEQITRTAAHSPSISPSQSILHLLRHIHIFAPSEDITSCPVY